MKVSSVFLPCCISLIAIATCPVQIAMAQHHHRHANNNNHQSNIDTTDIYSRSSEKTTADAIDTTLAFVDDATDGKDGQRNLIVSSHEEVVESNEEDESTSPNAAPKIEWMISSPTPPTSSSPVYAKIETVETDEGYHIFRNEHFDYIPSTTSSSITRTKESTGTKSTKSSPKSASSTDAKTGKAKAGKSDPPPPEPALCNGQCYLYNSETREMTITATSAGVCESGAVCVESLNGLPDANTVDLCPSLEEITDRCVPSSRPSTSPSEGPSNVPSGMPSKEPSSDPSLSPSSIPSNSPSFVPSTQPSLQPSYHPSISGLPSAMPSLKPSNKPSLSPSQQPSNEPSESPSFQPSESQIPTNLPTLNPTECIPDGTCLCNNCMLEPILELPFICRTSDGAAIGRVPQGTRYNLCQGSYLDSCGDVCTPTIVATTTAATTTAATTFT